MNRLIHKKILITGASQGLGRALALAFAREGASALSLTARNIKGLNSVKKEVQQITAQTQITIIEADISMPKDVERIAATTMNAFEGQLDVLVNNASVLGPSPMPFLLDYPLDDFQNVLKTNLVGPFLMIKCVLPSMIEHGGSIINVTSDAGNVGYAGWGAYGISKFGLEGLTQTWAAELAESDVRVNLVDPGNMNTAMHRAAEPEADPTQWANPENVTDVFLYLASDISKGITGMRFQAQEKWQDLLKPSVYG